MSFQANAVRTYDMPHEFVGKRLDHVITLKDENGDAENLGGWDPWGKIVDENNTTIVTLAPTVNAAGQFILNDLIPSNTTPGRYSWLGGVSDSTGGAGTVRLKGKITIKAY